MKTTKSRKLSKAKIYEAMHSEFYAVFSTIYALAIQQGREEERELCARVCEDVRDMYISDCMSGKQKQLIPYDKGAHDCATTIRSRCNDYGYDAAIAAAEEREACARIVERYYTECDTCRVKPGSPILCQGCLDNRDSITAAIRARGQGNEVVSTGYMQTLL